MTCEHGFIGPCSECDGSGQQPEACAHGHYSACPDCDYQRAAYVGPDRRDRYPTSVHEDYGPVRAERRAP